MRDPSKPVASEQLVRRIYGEYLEMPDLQLTCKQARRLFGLEEEACAKLLDEMVGRRLLARRPNGAYGRLTDGSPGTDSLLPAGSVDRLERTA